MNTPKCTVYTHAQVFSIVYSYLKENLRNIIILTLDIIAKNFISFKLQNCLQMFAIMTNFIKILILKTLY